MSPSFSLQQTKPKPNKKDNKKYKIKTTKKILTQKTKQSMAMLSVYKTK
jgi:hypothetical protein